MRVSASSEYERACALSMHARIADFSQLCYFDAILF